MGQSIDRRELERRCLLAAGVVTVAGAEDGAGGLAQVKESVIRVTARKRAFLPREIRLEKDVPAEGISGRIRVVA